MRGTPNPQKTKPMLKRYGSDIINHPLNMVATCCLKCNSAVAIGKSMTAKIDSIVDQIKQAIDKKK